MTGSRTRAAGHDVLRLSGMEQNAISEAAARHLRRAYERIGVKLEIFSLPRKRALIAADRGDLDGVVARAAIITRDYKNLLRVPTPVAYLRIRAYGRQGAKKSHPSMNSSPIASASCVACPCWNRKPRH